MTDPLHEATQSAEASTLRSIADEVERRGVTSLGILGGTFDPIHFGHLACAQFAMDASGIDLVLFMPAAVPTFKQDKQIAPATDRLAMTELATFDNERFLTSSLELDRSGITYTIDTVHALRSSLPDEVDISFIIGTDAILLLDGWKDIRALGRLVRFVCVSRPGYVLDDPTRARFEEIGIDVHLVAAPLLDISSTEIRTRVGEGRTVRYLTPLSVCDYIASHGLYSPSKRKEV